MSSRLCIFIGGSDDQNGDYSRLLRLAKSGGSVNWSSLKESKPGDRVLIYIRKPQSALIAKGVVLAPAVKGTRGDYAYRAKTGRFQLLANPVTIQELKSAFPGWNWLKYPRSKATVPERYVDRLWELVHKEQPGVQVLFLNATRGAELVDEMARNGRSAKLLVPNWAKIGDTVLYYVQRPVSAIVAVGTVLSKPKRTDGRWSEARIGAVRLLSSPISLEEWRGMFPGWKWLRNPHMFAQISPDRGRKLLARCATGGKASSALRKQGSGAGFGDYKANKVVERAAVKKATQLLESRGLKVVSREHEGIGYDLDAFNGRKLFHVEVKGISGDTRKFVITYKEEERARTDPAFRIMIVTRALERDCIVTELTRAQLCSRYSIRPIDYVAEEQRSS